MDSALPRFTISESSTKIKHDYSIYLRRPHSEPEPAYSLQHADPTAESSRNCYAAGLTDAYNNQVLFGEVLIQPKWTQPTLSAEVIRLNNGVSPPPEPIMPDNFTIQLYNPDQQVIISQRPGALLGAAKWEFSMPQDVFRQPSASILDRSQDDPIADLTTPRINFAWRRENKFSKELTCYVTGKNTDLNGKKRSKEPDIAIAAFKGLRDITIYEPNLNRVEMEDPKGLEVVILLSAAVLRDVFFGRDIRAVFNIADARRRSSSTSPALVGHGTSASGAHAAVGGLYAQSTGGRATAPDMTKTRLRIAGSTPPMINPRTQWEIDAESARLEAEERARRKEGDRLRREKERVEEEETKRLRRMVEQEDRDRKARERAVEEETKRLRKIYGVPGQSSLPTMSGANGPPTFAKPGSSQGTPGQSWTSQTQQTFQPDSQYQQQFNYPPRDANARPPPDQLSSGAKSNWRRSFLNLKITDEGPGPSKLEKKRSSVF